MQTDAHIQTHTDTHAQTHTHTHRQTSLRTNISNPDQASLRYFHAGSERRILFVLFLTGRGRRERGRAKEGGRNRRREEGRGSEGQEEGG
jgi:hypothetical protein